LAFTRKLEHWNSANLLIFTTKILNSVLKVYQTFHIKYKISNKFIEINSIHQQQNYDVILMTFVIYGFLSNKITLMSQKFAIN